MSKSTLLRVYISGVPVMVRSEYDREYLTHINRSLAVAKLALHKIANSHGEIDGPKTAAKAIQDMKENV
jgi:hypothetical protein